jgi:glycosyltransferase involved in cell wall biosynthesis
MKTRAPVSICIITRGEESLAAAVASVSPHVEEVCVLYCGRDDGSEEVSEKMAFAASCADRFGVIAPEGLDAEGRLVDFSAAREASFRLATQPWVGWMDSDDVLVGAENLAAAVRALEAVPNVRGMFRYEYRLTSEGDVDDLQYRERVVRNDGSFEWRRPVHETLTRRDGPSDDLRVDVVTWRHTRAAPEATDPGRNLRILERHAASHPEPDAWLEYNLGAEKHLAGRFAEAEAHFRRYLELSEWPDERAVVRVRLGDCVLAQGLFDAAKQDAALAEYALAGSERPDWFEPKYASAKVHFTRGMLDPKSLEEARDALLAALATPARVTSLGTRPVDRQRGAPEMLRVACESLCDWAGAERAVDLLLEHRPDDPGMRLQKKRYAALAQSLPDEVEESFHNVRDAAPKYNGLDVVFACGDALEPWNPKLSAKTGVGGSETAVMQVAERLARKGHRVRVFTNCGAEGLYGGVEYLFSARLLDLKRCDALVAWRTVKLLDGIAASVKWVWAHDLVVQGSGSSYYRSLPDRVLALSEFHRGVLEGLGFDGARITTTSNGVDPARFAGPAPERVATRAVYSSSPDRGLAELLDVWPRIRGRVPAAELHVFYGFDSTLAALAIFGRAEDRARVEAMRARCASTDGVVLRGRVGQEELAREFRSAGAWLYPSWHGDGPWLETSCVTAMEAACAGLVAVAGAHGALPETTAGKLVEGDARDPGWQDAFVEAAVEALEVPADDPRRAKLSASALARWDWQGVADRWDEMLRADHAERSAPRAEASDDPRPVFAMVLSPDASGHVAMDPLSTDDEAMGGGSRHGFMGLARAMGRLGRYRVRAYSTFASAAPVFDESGVEYVRFDRFRSDPAADVAFAFYDTRVLVDCKARLRIASHHTCWPYMSWGWNDVNTAPSEWALEHLRRGYGPTSVDPADWQVLPNAVEGLERVERRPVPGRVIYHTSPDRGLHVLLEQWPGIRERVPDATLHVVGDVNAFAYAGHAPRSEGERRALRLVAGLERAREAGGVELLGRLPRRELLRELAEASVFAFPATVQAPCETFSISILECLTIGLPVVLSPVDALASLWRGAVEVVGSPVEDHAREFGEAVARVLTRPELAASLSERGKLEASLYSFDRSARVLDGIVRRRLGSP